MPLEKPDFNREIRLGLVVYGGVSLAVYMNGVCREFYNAVRGRGVYKLIKALTDSDIVVDIISGTSAGGINGVLLSYALTNSNEKETFDFENFSGVWRNNGDISELLREVNSLGDVNSLLDGEGYYQRKLAGAFQSVWEKKSHAPNDDWFSDFDELDLFVTGTDVLGKVSYKFDNTGKLIEVNDHHAVFILKHRKNRKTPFQPDEKGMTQRALAKLCRITSCFPVAFPVVTIKLTNDDKNPDRDIDPKLVEWGDLSNRVKPNEEETENGYQLHFVDGGVLDNRPFSYTIREIYYRHFTRPVIRKLFYIDPSPDKFLDSTAFKKMAKPNIWESAMDSLVGLPRYESIAVDLQEIAEKNENVRRYKFLRSSVVARAAEELEEKISTNESAKQIYLRCRLIGLRDRVLPIITGLTHAKATTTNSDKTNILALTADLLAYIPDPDKQRAREEYLNKKGSEVEGLDVVYSIRKHLFILDEIVQTINDRKYHDLRERGFHKYLARLAQYLNRTLSLLEVIKYAIDEMLLVPQIQHYFAELIKETSQINALPELNKDQKKKKKEATNNMRNKIYSFLLNLHQFLLDPSKLISESIFEESENPPGDHSNPNSQNASLLQILKDNMCEEWLDTDPEEWLSTKSLDNVLHQLRVRAENWSKEDMDKDCARENMKRNYATILDKIDDLSDLLIRRLEKCLAEDPTLCERSPDILKRLRLKFAKFDYIDQQVYPYEFLSDIQSDTLVDIARISPDDSQKGFGKNKKLEERLAGLQLRAFGGFFKKSWRANDILWGRLDGLNRLVECLLTPKTVQSFMTFSERNPISHSDLIKEALPYATDEEKAFIKDALDNLSKGTELKHEDFQQFLDYVILAGQRSILTTDLKNVFNDTIEEQFSWNQQLGIPDTADLYKTSYRSVNHQTSSLNGESKGLQDIDVLLDCLLEPKSKFKDGCLNYIQKGIRPILNVTGQKGVEEYLRDKLANAFPNSLANDREDLTHRLCSLLLQLSNQQIRRFNASSKAFTSTFILALTPSIDLLLKISEQERKAQHDRGGGIVFFNDQLKNVANKLKQAVKPNFSPTNGYLDKPLIPFITGSLVDSSIQDIMNDHQQMENYFRYQYRVGSEKVRENIPPIILEKLLARSGLVIRDIIRSGPTGEVLTNSPPFQLADRLLRTFYVWIEAKDPATSFVPKVLRPLLPWMKVFVPLFGIAFLVSQIPRLLLGVMITILIAQSAYSILGRNGPSKLVLKVSSFLLVSMILAHEFFGLPLPHKGTIMLKRLFTNDCPIVQTPFTAKDCYSKYESKEALPTL